jgi:DNA-binding transcriptional ArsR family regulator
MSSESQESSTDSKYTIFQALSHPTRVRILTLVEKKELAFSSLKNELGIESNGQLQHHLQKLSPLIREKENGSYCLTDLGIRALGIYAESEKSGRSLAEICCIPFSTAMAHNKQIGSSGTLVRLLIGSVLLVLTAAILVSSITSGLAPLTLQFRGDSISLGIDGLLIFGFFGASFLISAFSGYPGCEITAIPNLFVTKKWYCGCLMKPFNLPNGRLLKK